VVTHEEDDDDDDDEEEEEDDEDEQDVCSELVLSISSRLFPSVLFVSAAEESSSSSSIHASSSLSKSIRSEPVRNLSVLALVRYKEGVLVVE
jgi:hypothetical protein